MGPKHVMAALLCYCECLDNVLLYCLPKREFTWSNWRKHQAIKLAAFASAARGGGCWYRPAVQCATVHILNQLLVAAHQSKLPSVASPVLMDEYLNIHARQTLQPLERLHQCALPKQWLWGNVGHGVEPLNEMKPLMPRRILDFRSHLSHRQPHLIHLMLLCLPLHQHFQRNKSLALAAAPDS